MLGIVLEPEVVDAQDDIYSAAEIREAAHRFMEEYRNIGLVHRGLVNGQVKILVRTGDTGGTKQPLLLAAGRLDGGTEVPAARSWINALDVAQELPRAEECANVERLIKTAGSGCPTARRCVGSSPATPWCTATCSTRATSCSPATSTETARRTWRSTMAPG